MMPRPMKPMRGRLSEGSLTNISVRDWRRPMSGGLCAGDAVAVAPRSYMNCPRQGGSVMGRYGDGQDVPPHVDARHRSPGPPVAGRRRDDDRHGLDLVGDGHRHDRQALVARVDVRSLHQEAPPVPSGDERPERFEVVRHSLDRRRHPERRQHRQCVVAAGRCIEQDHRVVGEIGEVDRCPSGQPMIDGTTTYGRAPAT